jgi:glyoxylase-like metal-dependent hydrolase (beta-lactamase superfamily II)
MRAKQIVPGIHLVSLGFVNAYLLEGDDGLTLIDSGMPGSAPKILDAVRSLGKQAADVRHIVLTHCHRDHTGSLAALKQATGARAFMHPLDAALVRRGEAARPVKRAPGLMAALVVRMMMRGGSPRIEPAEIEHEIDDGAVLGFAGGLRAVHAPGHCAGQLAFLWPHRGGVLIAADACAAVFGLGLSVIYEDLELGRRSLGRLAALDFEVAVFGHGSPITSGATRRFREKWGGG